MTDPFAADRLPLDASAIARVKEARRNFLAEYQAVLGGKARAPCHQRHPAVTERCGRNRQRRFSGCRCARSRIWRRAVSFPAPLSSVGYGRLMSQNCDDT
jgi:hypothetical protein